MKAKLKDLAIGKLEYGCGAAACEYNYNIRYIRITDIDNEGQLGGDIVSPSYYEDKYLLNEGDILFARTGATVGKTIRYREQMGKCIYAGFLIRFIPNQKIVLPDYVYYFTKSFQYNLFVEENMKVVAQPNINAKQYGDLELDVPSIAEQHIIINKLNKISDLVAMRKKQLQKLDELVKSRFIELFGDPKYNKSNLVKIEEIGILTSGGTPSRAKPEYFEGDIRWYSAGELNTLYLPDSAEHISETALQESSAKLFNKGTLMIGMYDTAAFKMGILTEDSSSNQACANLNPKQGYNIVWLYYLFDIMKPVFLQERQGVRQKNLSLSKIKEFEVPIAPFELQEQFATFVEQTDKSKLAVQKSLKKLETLKKSLMQEFFG